MTVDRNITKLKKITADKCTTVRFKSLYNQQIWRAISNCKINNGQRILKCLRHSQKYTSLKPQPGSSFLMTHSQRL